MVLDSKYKMQEPERSMLFTPSSHIAKNNHERSILYQNAQREVQQLFFIPSMQLAELQRQVQGCYINLKKWKLTVFDLSYEYF